MGKQDMHALAVRAFTLLIIGGVYWQIVCQGTGAREPWDADTYWYLWYPISCLLSAIAGILFRKKGWLAGGIITFSQLPILWLNNGEGSLVAVGLLFLTLLAVPTIALSALAGWCAVRVRSA